MIARLDTRRDINGIPGTAYKKDGAVIVNTQEYLEDLDTLPFPDRSLTAKYRKSYFSEWMRPLASIRTSKGRFFRCNFCALWKLTGGKYVTRNPAKIAEELLTIEEDSVFFSDDESLLDAQTMRVLADLIKKAGIKKQYSSQGTAAWTTMFGCKGRMVEWWFGFMRTTEQYKWWHPKDHVWCEWVG